MALKRIKLEEYVKDLKSVDQLQGVMVETMAGSYRFIQVRTDDRIDNESFFCTRTKDGKSKGLIYRSSSMIVIKEK